MGKFTDLGIRNWIRSSERFEARGDGDGLYLRYRNADRQPRWPFRYRRAGKQRTVDLGRYSHLSLSSARKTAKEMRAHIALGYDPAGKKKQRRREAVAKIESDKSVTTVAALADEYFAARILGRWKHPNIVRSRIDRGIKPAVGKLAIGEVRPSHIDAMLEGIYNRHGYFAERRAGLQAWANLLSELEFGGTDKVIPFKRAAN